MHMTLRSIPFAIVILLFSCTKPAPGTCCVTEAQCEAFGVDEIRLCDVGQACAANFTCVAKECDSSAECTTADKPICSLGLCVASCQIDDDCADVAGKPFCATDGACVGCTTNDQCPAETAFCDGEDRACRGCERDDECASGVCIEGDGVCAETAEVVFVSSLGSDSGTCPESSPCASVAFAMQHVTAVRGVVHVIGSATSDATTVTLGRAVIIDGTGTVFRNPMSGPMFTLPASGGAYTVTIEGIQLANLAVATAITVGTAKTLRLHAVTLENASVQTTNGAVDVRRSTIRTSDLDCMTGTASFDGNRFEGSSVNASNCQITATRNRFDGAPPGGDSLLSCTGGVVSVLNNVFTVNSESTPWFSGPRHLAASSGSTRS